MESRKKGRHNNLAGLGFTSSVTARCLKGIYGTQDNFSALKQLRNLFLFNSRFAAIWDSCRRPFVSMMNLYKRLIVQRAGFVACLCQNDRSNLLTLFCYPLHLKMQIYERLKRFSSEYVVPRQGEGESEARLCDEDMLFVHLSDAFIVQPKYTKNLSLV